MRTLKIAPFGGVVTSLDAHEIQPYAASSALNVDYEEGKLNVRKGFRIFSSLNKTNAFGLSYIQGFDKNKMFTDEYVVFLEQDGVVRPYQVHATTGAVTEITNETERVSVPAYPTLGFSFNENSYFFQTNGSSTFKVRKHEIGNTESFIEIGVPDAPPGDSIAADVLAGGSGDILNWTDWADPLTLSDSNEFASSGVDLAGSSVSGGTLTLNHTSPGDKMFEIKMDGFSMGIQDWEYNDRFILLAYNDTQSSIDMTATIKMTVINKSGIEIVSENVIIQNMGSKIYKFFFIFDHKIREEWKEIRAFRIDYKTTGTGKITFYVSPGGVDQTDDAFFDTPGPIVYGYTYYNSDDDLESDIGATISIDEKFYKYAGGTWTRLQVAPPPNDPSITHFRFYIKNNQSGSWHLIETVPINAMPYTDKFSYTEKMGFKEFSSYPFKSTEVLYAIPFKGWVVWGYKGDYQNIRHTRVGSAVQQSSNFDTEDDFIRGATFSLIGDEPIFMADCGDSLLIAGRHGIYAQIGTAPYLMTPPKRLPGSYGIPNAFGAVRWLDDGGRLGIAALSYNLEGIYFYSVSEGFGEEEGYRPIELTTSVRPSLKSFLIEEQGFTIETARSNIFLAIDQNQDALWVILKKRAMVLRRKSLVDGARQWHFYEYNIDTIQYPAFSTRRWLKWLNAAKEIHEIEFDTSRNAFIEGANRDGGNPIPEDTIYWQTKIYRDLNRRVLRIRREAENLEDDIFVEVESTRRTKKYQFPFRKRHVRVGVEQSGFDHRFKFFLPETASTISAFFVEETPIGQRKTS